MPKHPTFKQFIISNWTARCYPDSRQDGGVTFFYLSWTARCHPDSRQDGGVTFFYLSWTARCHPDSRQDGGVTFFYLSGRQDAIQTAAKMAALRFFEFLNITFDLLRNFPPLFAD